MRRIWASSVALCACASSLGAGPSESARPRALPLTQSERQNSEAPADTAATRRAEDPAAQLEATEPIPQVFPFRMPLPDVSERLQGPATRWANLSPAECSKRARDAELSLRRAGASANIAAPVRLGGPLGDVLFRVPPDKTKWGLLDCRLALTFWEIAPVLREHEVRAIRIDNFYRPRAKLPAGKGKKKKSQHAYGLAADIVSFTLDDGRELEIERDFHGQRGQPVCGPEAAVDPLTDESLRLRNLVCELARRGAFHHILTPNHDRAHENHLHVDIKRDNRWFSIE